MTKGIRRNSVTGDSQLTDQNQTIQSSVVDKDFIIKTNVLTAV